jgi:hypothetical protein
MVNLSSSELITVAPELHSMLRMELDIEPVKEKETPTPYTGARELAAMAMYRIFCALDDSITFGTSYTSSQP